MLYGAYIEARLRMLVRPDGACADDLRDIGKAYIRSGDDFTIAHIAFRLAAMGGLKAVDRDVAELTRIRVRSRLSSTRPWKEDSS
ncbi:hypothetical protein ACVSQB_39575 [Bradyrhizobium elkanii]|uniref:hypothetical protein n=1 Tax=Bradyrhizobium sp. BRP56 TaxID=2793819 RepID=UPI001CD585BC|nr:hypothetical protein [Bradyrhizobium sp. BRP56]MCA1398985.1 hypothetical protein [Bradyrhizobium sp. BRP56]